MDGNHLEPHLDQEEIRRVAMDYAEGWYTGDPERMARACHDDFVKRTLVRKDESDGWTSGPVSTKAALVAWTAEGGGSQLGLDLEYEIEVLDIFRDIASVRCLSAEYVDYLHLARFGEDGWQIVNVLWQVRQGEFSPSTA